ncbi:hypothetical protein M758_5G145900 [Ceratodon purpureus]|nr:hypothetical protein M758_5G145900 [Ceratodon purpureus]
MKHSILLQQLNTEQYQIASSSRELVPKQRPALHINHRNPSNIHIPITSATDLNQHPDSSFSDKQPVLDLRTYPTLGKTIFTQTPPTQHNSSPPFHTLPTNPKTPLNQKPRSLKKPTLITKPNLDDTTNHPSSRLTKPTDHNTTPSPSDQLS